MVVNRTPDALVASVPPSEALEVFKKSFARRNEGKGSEIKHVFHALYRLMREEDIQETIKLADNALRKETDTSEIAKIFRLIRADMWTRLADDVRIRMENLIIAECRKGRYDAYGGLQAGGFGSWGKTFGRAFSLRKDLTEVLIKKLYNDWYTQNYVGNYYLNALPGIIRGSHSVREAAEALAYALLVNKANIVRTRFKEVCANYPDHWKEALRVAIQEGSDSDSEYAKEVIQLLS